MRNDSALVGEMSFGSTTQNFAASRSDTSRAATFAIAFGAFLVFLTGFSHTDALHNGAHNTRHALSFPCH